MTPRERTLVERTEHAAVEVLLHNARGPCRGLPRTAGWGYPEPYTRDMMICSLGILINGHEKLVQSLRRVLETAAAHQSSLGHIPSLVHSDEDRGASDTTPLFLVAVAVYRRAAGEPGFLAAAVNKALTWMDYQSPEDRTIVSQLPTSDWRDEQWILGYGLFVNAVYYAALRLHGRGDRADRLADMMGHFAIDETARQRHVHEGLVLRHKPYYAAWSYKVYRSERFDLLGNSLAILTGIASRTRSKDLVAWIEAECRSLRKRGLLAVDLPPNFFPYIQPGDPDWRPRYERFNRPGEYHNGGLWPFICGFYVAALVAAGRRKLAEKKLLALTALVKPSRTADVDCGFNEWVRAQDGTVQGQDWQSWSAAMYLYAAHCVRHGRTPWFDEVRQFQKK